MSKYSYSTIVTQLEALLAKGDRVSFEQTGNGFEVTVFESRKHHSHHQGATIAEAINRAVRATTSGPPEDKP